ncbi:MAG TPA: CorA family divalent cation transporter [Burkholderiaceae bacterium]|nr:CorA family divalent cation transporter [Burkholderiaceae bacterium]
MAQSSSDATHVRHFRQILLWPLQLMPQSPGSQIQKHCEALETVAADNPWREVLDEFTEDGGEFQVRHYTEFVTFLPYVQRFLYGEGRARRTTGSQHDPGASPMRVFRRSDVAAVRVTPTRGAAPIELTIAQVNLIFFFDIDIVLLNVEVHRDDLSLATAQDLLYGFGRAYPAGWDERGDGLHCMHRVEWLDREGRALAASDSSERERFLEFVRRHRAPRISSHWTWLLQPLALDYDERPGAIRYRQIEYYRMPVMALLAVDDPRAISRNDFVRLGLVVGAGESETLPYSDRHVADFEGRHCYDRFWCESGAAPNTRYLACGHALVVVGCARSGYFLDRESGVLAQFRHQHFLLFLVAHFQKAALLMFSDRLVVALRRLEIGVPASVKTFKRAIRQNFEIFLRFTHRYWFHEISDQALARSLFELTAGHLQLDALYDEVQHRIRDMNQYLEADTFRRQANTMVRLTVVTTFGLVGTVTTGFLGMNLIAAAEEPMSLRVFYLLVTLVATVALTLYTLSKSRRFSDLLDALADERMTMREKWDAFLAVWRRGNA